MINLRNQAFPSIQYKQPHHCYILLQKPFSKHERQGVWLRERSLHPDASWQL